mgnify:CR=1 FL=1
MVVDIDVDDAGKLFAMEDAIDHYPVHKHGVIRLHDGGEKLRREPGHLGSRAAPIQICFSGLT